ncbi:MAG: hypothetical protein C0442_09945 [Chlorobiaceae bacterium]|nr:hypothetical protein [Chlorobiaceae bacterium]
MENKASSLRLGIFVFIGFLLLMVAVFLIGSKEALFTKTFSVRTYFNNIEGLRQGAPVRLSGINVGSVSDIKISTEQAGKVEVVLRLESDVQKFIKPDSRASIETEGLVGNKVVLIKMGSSELPSVKDGDIILSDEPIGFAAIIVETQGTLENIKVMTKNLSDIIEKVNTGEGSIGKLINDDELYLNANKLLVSADKNLNVITSQLDTLANVINNLGVNVQSIVQNVDGVITELDTIISNVNQGKGLLGSLLSEESVYNEELKKVITNLRMTTDDAKIGVARFSENMEALKRNWLFKSYFEQRGFYDKTEYERSMDQLINQMNERIKILDLRIEDLRKLEKK